MVNVNSKYTAFGCKRMSRKAKCLILSYEDSVIEQRSQDEFKEMADNWMTHYITEKNIKIEFRHPLRLYVEGLCIASIERMSDGKWGFYVDWRRTPHRPPVEAFGFCFIISLIASAFNNNRNVFELWM